MWDLKGKALGRSVCDLLGGPVHERLPAIASSHAHFESIPEMVEEAQGWLDGGLHGVKVGFGKRGDAHLGYEHDRDVEYVRAMREGIGADKQLDHRPRHRHQVGRRHGRAARARLRRVRHRLDRGAARGLGPRGLRHAARQDRDADRLRREGVDARGLRARPRHRHVRRRRLRPGPGRGHHRVQEDRRPRRGLPAPGQRPRLVVGDRHGGEPGDLVLVAGVQAVRGQAAAQPDAARARQRPPFETVDGYVFPPTERPGLGIDVIEEVVDRYRERPRRASTA